MSLERPEPLDPSDHPSKKGTCSRDVFGQWNGTCSRVDRDLLAGTLGEVPRAEKPQRPLAESLKQVSFPCLIPFSIPLLASRFPSR